MSAPTPQQITDWLEKLGLGQYAQRFVENEITHSILPDLTDADLKELGVSALGHRRLLLRAIAELDGVEKRTPTHPAAATATVIPEQRDSMSTPEQKCIGWPERKYISDASQKAPETGVFCSGIRLGSDYLPAYPSSHGVSGAYSD